MSERQIQEQILQSMDSYWDTTPTELHQPSQYFSSSIQPNSYSYPQQLNYNQPLHSSIQDNRQDSMILNPQEQEIWRQILLCYKKYEVKSIFECTLLGFIEAHYKHRCRINNEQIKRDEPERFSYHNGCEQSLQLFNQEQKIRLLDKFVEKGLVRKENREGKYGGKIYTIDNGL